jgi:hypothetical protein
MRASNLVIGRGHKIDSRIECVSRAVAYLMIASCCPITLGAALNCRGGLADAASTGTERPLWHELRSDASLSFEIRPQSRALYTAIGALQSGPHGREFRLPRRLEDDYEAHRTVLWRRRAPKPDFRAAISPSARPGLNQPEPASDPVAVHAYVPCRGDANQTARAMSVPSCDQSDSCFSLIARLLNPGRPIASSPFARLTP